MNYILVHNRKVSSRMSNWVLGIILCSSKIGQIRRKINFENNLMFNYKVGNIMKGLR